MPMNFPDMKSLIEAADVWDFRDPRVDEGETEEHYRNVLADFVLEKDIIESEEIRNGVGWDKWNATQRENALKRKIQHNALGLQRILRLNPDFKLES